MNKGIEIKKTLSSLQSERAQLDSYWDKAFEYSFPLRGQGFLHKHADGNAMQSAARKDQAQLFDTTATDACRLFAASMISGLTPANSKWFNLTLPGVDTTQLNSAEKNWFEDATAKLHQMIHGSNYNSEAYEFFIDISAGGMSGLYVEQLPSGQFKFEHWSLADMWVAETLGRGVIDTVYRCLYYTPAQAVERFGLNNLPQPIKDKFNKDAFCTEKYEFIHAIRPRMKGKKQSQGQQARNMPWESVYVEKESNTIVQEGGFLEFPVIIPRWLRIPKSNYAVGPLDAALPDVLTLNKVKQIVLTNGEMQIAGTFVAKEDGILNPNTIRIGARKVIFAADPKNIQPLASGGDFRIAEWLIGQLQEQIRKVMMSDQLQPTDKPYSTATEVQMRLQLIRRLLGPAFSRFESEYLGPLITRCFGLAFRSGYLGQPPSSLTSQPLLPEYQSPLARAQKMETVDSMMEFEQMMVSKLQLDPTLADLYDLEAATRLQASLTGVPTNVMRDDKAVNRIRRERAEQQQAAAQQEAMIAGMQGEQ